MSEMRRISLVGDGLGPSILIIKRRRYYIAILAFVGYVVSYSTRVNLSVAILYMTMPKNVTVGNTTKTEKEFDWDEKTQGVILSSFFYGYILTQIPGGYLSGIIGGNHVLNLGVAGSGLLSFLGPVCVRWNVPAVVILRVLCGLFQGVTVPAMSSLWARWAPPLERTILSTIAISGNFFSSFIIMPICSAIGDHLHWEWMFYIFGITSVVWCLIWGFTVFAGPEQDRFIKKSELEYIQRAIGERTDKKPVHPWGKIFTSMAVGAAVVSQTGHNWGYYIILLQGPKFYHSTLRYSVKSSSLFTGISFTITGALMIVFGQISDILRKKKRMATVRVRKMMCCGGFSIQIIFMLLLCFIKNRECCVAFTILAIGMGGITWSAFNVNPLDIAPPHASIIAGIQNSCATLSGIFAPTVASLFLDDRAIYHSLDNWVWTWAICAIVYFLSGVFFLIFAAGEKQKWVRTEA